MAHPTNQNILNFKDQWSRRESNPCPRWLLTSRSFTGLAFLTLKAGTANYPWRQDSLVKS